MSKLLFLIAVILFVSVGVCFAQVKSSTTPAASDPVKSSPAYAEILLRKTELESDFESLIIEYTEEYPKITEIKYELSMIKKESDRLLAVKPADSAKLTLALGKLIVKKISLETDLWALLKNYNDGHPDVKRAKRKVEIFERAIKEILG